MEGLVLMFNKNKEEKELLYAEISRLKKVNRKLEDENTRLRENSEMIGRYRMEYEKLIKEMKSLKSKYEKYAGLITKAEKNYKREYDRLAQKTGMAGRQG